MGGFPKGNDDGMFIIIYEGVSDCKGDGNIYRDEKRGGDLLRGDTTAESPKGPHFD